MELDPLAAGTADGAILEPDEPTFAVVEAAAMVSVLVSGIGAPVTLVVPSTPGIVTIVVGPATVPPPIDKEVVYTEPTEFVPITTSQLVVTAELPVEVT